MVNCSSLMVNCNENGHGDCYWNGNGKHSNVTGKW